MMSPLQLLGRPLEQAAGTYALSRHPVSRNLRGMQMQMKMFEAALLVVRFFASCADSEVTAASGSLSGHSGVCLLQQGDQI